MPRNRLKVVDTVFSTNLMYYRKQNNFTQQQVADILNIERTTYTKYETAISEPPFFILRKIVKLYNIDYNSLFYPNTQNNS